MRAVSRLCEFYPGICLTTEEKARKNLSQGKTLQNPQKHTHYKTLKNTHITKPSKTHKVQNTHTLQNPQKHTHYKTPTH